MLAILRNRQFRRLFSAQLLSLGGIGLMTVGLALLAYDMSGGDAGIVLGTLLAIKMIAYVGFAPLASALFDRMPTRRLLVALDVLRALRHSGLATLRHHLFLPALLGGLHASLSKRHSRYSAGGEGLHVRAIAFPPGL